MIRSVATIEGQIQIVPSQRAATLGARLIAAEKRRANRDIEALAPTWKQLNAARGAYDADKTAALFAAIDARRDQENVYAATVQAILDDELQDDDSKLAALQSI